MIIKQISHRVVEYSQDIFVITTKQFVMHLHNFHPWRSSVRNRHVLLIHFVCKFASGFILSVLNLNFLLSVAVAIGRWKGSWRQGLMLPLSSSRNVPLPVPLLVEFQRLEMALFAFYDLVQQLHGLSSRYEIAWLCCWGVKLPVYVRSLQWDRERNRRICGNVLHYSELLYFSLCQDEIPCCCSVYIVRYFQRTLRPSVCD